MSCCGRQRATTPETRTAVSGDTPGASPATPPAPAVTRWLRYVGVARVVVHGPATRRRYEFAATRAVQAVDVRDAPQLLRTGWFRFA